MADNRAVLTAVIAVIAVLALGVAAATLDSATTTNSGGFGFGSASGAGIGNDEGSQLPLGDSANGSAGPATGLAVCVTFLTRPLVQLLLLGGVVLFFGAAYRVMGSALLSGIFTVSALVPFAVVYLVLTSCRTGGNLFPAASPAPANNSSLGSGGGNAGLNAAGEAVSTPTALAAVLLAVAVLGSLALLFVSTGDDDEGVADDEPEIPDPEQRAAVGVAAGEAADRLEGDSGLENEVYRAWREMTDLLDVDRPASSTPAEFAAAAVEAGMDREDVLALTDVFEEVRYGGADPTPDREERAIDALRQIEETYGDEERAVDADRDDERDEGGER
ncbi:DUF4129 domain-containing protein [Candidatus Halobonum tyrrellensis]|uniref:Protein-glutamine gamma-glutamyltransferase-like C-terminal domain-containing protein n=1 Tax=Candidatus Halobonum tyrrellensis G22 TaxID=1324957 RepID=V4HBP8_9EURY|nr:DUF4129 domain-containing protein [Candidatus Halobonum tyrrellensis]ESP88135.1 hypothetical protein K933_10607 [Candidatus Halobonum tyrrellensis G22]